MAKDKLRLRVDLTKHEPHIQLVNTGNHTILMTSETYDSPSNARNAAEKLAYNLGIILEAKTQWNILEVWDYRTVLGESFISGTSYWFRPYTTNRHGFPLKRALRLRGSDRRILLADGRIKR